MLIDDILSFLEKKIAPKVYKRNSEPYGLIYDNSSKSKVINKILITVDLSLEAIKFAIRNKINLIISNQGLVQKSIYKFDQDIINKFYLMSKCPLSIFTMNTPFIVGEEGVTDNIVEALSLRMEKPLNFNIKNDKKIPLGRICSPFEFPNQKKSITLETLINRIKQHLNAKYILFTGDLKQEIKKVLIVIFETSKISLLKSALKNECNCFISGKITYRDAIFAREHGLCAIEIPQYLCELYAIKKLKNILSLEYPREEFLIFEEKEPINIY